MLPLSAYGDAPLHALAASYSAHLSDADLSATALQDPTAMDKLAPVVADSGEGRWTVDEAIRQGTPVPVISAALMARFASQGKADTTNRLLALMRKGFGGHQTVEKS